MATLRYEKITTQYYVGRATLKCCTPTAKVFKVPRHTLELIAHVGKLTTNPNDDRNRTAERP